MTVAEYFDGLANSYPRHSPGAVDASNMTTLWKRWDAMGEAIKGGADVLDVGCGWGGFGEWLVERGGYGEYQGVDVSAELVKQAKDLDVYHGDVMDIGVFHWDYVVGQGLFYKQAGHYACLDILDKMWDLATKAVVVTTILRGQEGELSFPVSVLLGWVEDIGCDKWTLRHDYHPNDVCLYLYK